MNKHTPGPWVYHGQGEVRDSNRIPVAEAYMRADNICADDANGRLIAAAPKLLDALVSLAAQARRYLPDYDEHPEVQKADDAIAEARGEK